jgi:hypothetical protein
MTQQQHVPLKRKPKFYKLTEGTWKSDKVFGLFISESEEFECNESTLKKGYDLPEWEALPQEDKDEYLKKVRNEMDAQENIELK